MTILISSTGESPELWRDALATRLPDETIVLSPDEDEASRIDYAVVWQQPRGVLSRLPALKAIFSLGAGVDHVLSDPTLPDVPVVRIVAEDLTNRMSEYVVWRVLDHMRQGRLYREQQAAALWRDRSQPAAASVSVGILASANSGATPAASWGRSASRCWAGAARSAPSMASKPIAAATASWHALGPVTSSSCCCR